DDNGGEIEAQDAPNHNHITRWRYGTVTYLGIPVRRLTGPEPVDPAVINPDIEANLFDLDSIDFTAAPKLVTDAIAHAHLQDPATVTGMEIARQTFILPQPSGGDGRWARPVRNAPARAQTFSPAPSRM